MWSHLTSKTSSSTHWDVSSAVQVSFSPGTGTFSFSTSLLHPQPWNIITTSCLISRSHLDPVLAQTAPSYLGQPNPGFLLIQTHKPVTNPQSQTLFRGDPSRPAKQAAHALSSPNSTSPWPNILPGNVRMESDARSVSEAPSANQRRSWESIEVRWPGGGLGKSRWARGLFFAGGGVDAGWTLWGKAEVMVVECFWGQQEAMRTYTTQGPPVPILRLPYPLHHSRSTLPSTATTEANM